MGVVGNTIYFYSRSESYFEFSNFYYNSFELGGKWWKTVEHYFQASKSLNESDREVIRQASTPAVAKRMGKVVKLRGDWEEVKEDVMYSALKAKFTQNTKLRLLLLSTAPYRLAEHSPDDVYWGYKGKNRLGELLMKLRDELSGED